MKKIELLAPAGNRERLDFAMHYGADAVYCGYKQQSLRAFADNFTIEELTQAANEVHKIGKKIYVTLNAFMRSYDISSLKENCKEIALTGVDAIIVSDPAALLCAKEVAPQLEVHISTQANTLNYMTANFWHKNGASRIILARELSLDEIREMRDHIPDDLELECFVHGAMCMSYSGRCMLSNYLDGRDGNRGACIQPCRWGYEIRHVGADGAWHHLEQDEHGTYLFNSNDLNLIAHLQELIDAGVSSLKIEGRMKTAFYVANVVNAYRMALDDVQKGLPIREEIQAELEKLRHRPYTTGFIMGKDEDTIRESQYENAYDQTHEFVGVVLDYDEATGRALVEQRNRFFVGDTIEIMSPGKTFDLIENILLFDMNGNALESAPHAQQKLWIPMPPVIPKAILRKALNQEIRMLRIR